MRLPRMTTRLWMVAVPVVALLRLLEHRRRSCELLAVYHKPRRRIVRSLFDPRDVHQFHPDFKFLTWDEARVFEWHDAMARKYQHAARYPWLPVAPDPPEPERIPSGPSGDSWLVRTLGRGTMRERETGDLDISLTSPTPQGRGMRRPRVRLTVRAMTIVVAVAALLTGGFTLAKRSAHYRPEARYHSRAAARTAGAKHVYHDQLVKKYTRAAYRPWFPLDPDPPDLD